MQRFDYEILIGRAAIQPAAGVEWYFASTMAPAGVNLLEILKQLGLQGWEVVGIGNLGYDQQNEIVLKRAI